MKLIFLILVVIQPIFSFSECEFNYNNMQSNTLNLNSPFYDSTNLFSNPVMFKEINQSTAIQLTAAKISGKKYVIMELYDYSNNYEIKDSQKIVFEFEGGNYLNYITLLNQKTFIYDTNKSYTLTKFKVDLNDSLLNHFTEKDFKGIWINTINSFNTRDLNVIYFYRKKYKDLIKEIFCCFKK